MKKFRMKMWGDDGRPIDDFKSNEAEEIIDRVKRLIKKTR